MLFRIASLVAFLTIISKILGLARDLVIAHYFGTTMMADAFNMAYMFTGNIFVIFGGIGGPFYSALVAVLPKLQDKPIAAWLLSKSLLVKSALASLIFSVFFFFIKEPFLRIFVDKVNDPEYFALTIFNVDLLIPLLLITAPIGILYGILNCYHKYYAPSLSPAVLNIALIIAVLVMGDAYNGLALALGTSIGGVLSLVVNFGSFAQVRKEIMSSRESHEVATVGISSSEDTEGSLHPFGAQDDNGNGVQDDKQSEANDDKQSETSDDVKLYKDQYYKILYPTLMSTLISQLVVLSDSFFCKGLPEGSWTAITLANRIIQMPLGVLVTGFLVPLFPRLAMLVHQNNLDEVKRLLRKSLTMLTLLTVPAMIIGLIWSEDLIRIVFQRGAFDERSTAMVSTAFFYLCFSIVPYFFRDTYARTLYSFGDSKTPFYAMLLAIVLKFGLNMLLVPSMGIAGMAISTSVVSVVNGLILFIVVKTRFLK